MIGKKLAQKLRTYILQRPSELDLSAKANLVLQDERKVLVRDVRKYPGMGAEILERILGGPGSPHGIGARIWDLLNGCDNVEVGQAREMPTQISIEDSYIRLDTLDDVLKELHMLATSLIKRMHTDLLVDEEDDDNDDDDDDDDDKDLNNERNNTDTSKPSVSNNLARKRWLAFPKTIRLSTRPRLPAPNPDGSRNRSFARTSRSAPMPNFIFSLKENIVSLSERLVSDALVPLFRRLHPEKNGWNLSLVNVAATNMVVAASDHRAKTGGASSSSSVGRDIGKMFRRQDEVLRPWKVIEEEPKVKETDVSEMTAATNELLQNPEQQQQRRRLAEQETNETTPVQWTQEDVQVQVQAVDMAEAWEQSEDAYDDEDMANADETFQCPQCRAVLPLFATEAHNRWHEQR